MRCHVIVVTVALLLFTEAKFYVSADTSNPTSRGYTNYSEERASNVLTHTLEELIQQGVHPNDAFGLQGLHTAGDDLLSSAALGVWMKYLEYFKNENPTEEVSLLGMLLSHYGDDGVARIIETGIKTDSCEESAKLLQSELIQHWLNYEKTPVDDEFQIRGRTPDEVFALLKLDKTDDISLLKSPLLSTWIKYVDAYNQSKHQHVLLCEPFVNHLDGEERKTEIRKLVEMLIEAESVSNTKDIAIRMQSDVTQYMLSAKEKYPPDEVFPLLGLDTLDSELIENPRLFAWFRYAEDWRVKHVVRVDTMAIITEYYSDFGLVSMIFVANREESTKPMAERLKFLLFGHWIRQFRGKAYKTIYEGLELDMLETFQFNHPTFLVWIEFVFYVASISNQSDRKLIESMKNVLIHKENPGLFSEVEINTWLCNAIIAAGSYYPEYRKRSENVLNEFIKGLFQAKTDPEVFAKIVGANMNARRKITYEDYQKRFLEYEKRQSKRPRTSSIS